MGQYSEIVLGGCGGTGSWRVPHLCRIVREINRSGKKASLTMVDPDLVESKNTLRQCFSEAEVGLPKATTLALRYGAVWGLEITAFVDRFKPEHVQLSGWNTLTILVGAVDNAAARQSLAAVLEKNRSDGLSLFWLDLGNVGQGSDSGQVLLGNTASPQSLQKAFALPGLCTALPSPALQHPELLVPRPEELANHNLSCAELSALNLQSMMINARVAVEAADYLSRLTLTGNLKRFCTYLSLEAGVARSTYITTEAVGKALGQESEFFSTLEEITGKI